jgi:hypothetical protein
MQTLRRAIDRWLFEEYRTDPESLALFRIFFSVFVLLAEIPTGLWSIPAAAYSPPVSLAAFFTAPPPHWVMLGLNCFALLCASSLLIGMYTTASSLGLAFGIMTINSFCFADGKIDQGLVIWIALILARSGWGSRFSVDEHWGRVRPDDSAPDKAWLVATLVMVIGFALFTAGFAKARGGWLQWGTYGTRYHLFWDYYVFGRKTPVATWAWGHLPAWAWKCADVATVIWEVGFIASVARRSWCRIACALGAFFHFGVWLLFDIHIASNVVAYAIVANWAAIWPAATEGLRSWLQRPAATARRLLCLVPFLFAGASLFVFDRALKAQISLVTGELVLSAGLVAGLWYLGARLKDMVVPKSVIAGAGAND